MSLRLYLIVTRIQFIGLNNSNIPEFAVKVKIHKSIWLTKFWEKTYPTTIMLINWTNQLELNLIKIK